MIIKLENIRIGNWFMGYDGRPFKWSLGEFGLLWECRAEIDEIIKSPIPLTPEILEKCKFIKHINSNEYWTFWMLPNNWYISQSHHNEPSAGVKEDCFYWGEEYIEIKSVHHLQNFYSCHTGKQLEANL